MAPVGAGGGLLLALCTGVGVTPGLLAPHCPRPPRPTPSLQFSPSFPDFAMVLCYSVIWASCVGQGPHLPRSQACHAVCSGIMQITRVIVFLSEISSGLRPEGTELLDNPGVRFRPITPVLGPITWVRPNHSRPQGTELVGHREAKMPPVPEAQAAAGH